MLRRTPTAAYILFRPGVHFKPIKGYALLADGNRSQLCPNLAIESILVHAQVGRGIAESDQAGLDLHALSAYVHSSYLGSDMAYFSTDGQAGLLVDLTL